MSKKLFSKVFILLLVVGLLFAVAPTGQALAQTGTPDATWYIDGPTSFTLTDADDLAGLAQLVNAGNNFSGKTILLGANIDLSAYTNWDPIGGSWGEPTFRGVFDGQGHVISNLTSNRPDEEFVGLFGSVAGTIQNFALTGVNVTGRNQVGGAAGMLYTDGTANDVIVSNATINAKHYAGGIAGYVYGQLDGVQANNVTITLTFDTVANDNGDKGGGLVGYISESTLGNCSATDVTVSGTRDVGGLVGAAGDTTISNCTVNGATVTSTNIDGNTLTPYTGGAVGRASHPLTITNVLVTDATLTSTPEGYTGLVVGGGVGPVTINNVKLVHDTTETFFATIQAAINAAVDGDTIQVAAGTYNLTTAVQVDKEVTITGPTTGEATVIGVGGGSGTTTLPDKVFEITAPNVTIENLSLTLASMPGTYTGMISVPDSSGPGIIQGITISNNKMFLPQQSGAMGTWWGQGINLGRYVGGAVISGNEIYNTRSGIVVSYNSQVNITNNVIYNTKGGIMNYTGSLADAANRVMTGNSWGTVHNEWDIVWNTGGAPYDMDMNIYVLQVSQANNDAYVCSLMSTLVPQSTLTGNRSHVFAATTGTTTVRYDNGNINLPYAKIQDAIDAVVPGGKVIVAAGTYAEDLEIGKTITILGPNVAISPNGGARVAEAIVAPLNEDGVADPAVLITASNITVTLKGLTFDMVNTLDDSDRFVESINKTGVTMVVEKNQFLNAPSCINGNWYITGTTNPFSLTLKDNYFTGSKDSNGISLWGNAHTVDIQNNVWKDNGGWAVNFNNVTGTFANNQVLDTIENGIEWYDEQAGFLFASENHLTLTNNTFDGLPNPSIRIYETFSGTLTATDNTFSNTEDATIGVIRISNGAVLTGVNFAENLFLNNPIVVQNLGTGTTSLDVTPNWWGSIAGPTAAQLVGTTTFNPWCANAECTEFLPATVTIAPVTPVVCGVTTTSTIDINVAGIPASNPLQGYQFRLNFDETKTNVANLATDIVNGGFILNGGYLVATWIDETTGAISTTPTGILDIGYTQFTPSASFGDGKLASIKLTHAGVPGDIDFTLTNVTLSSRDGIVIPAEASATATTLTLQPAVLNTTKGVGYCTLAEAVLDATIPAAGIPGDILKLQADIAIPATVTVDKALTLDLNGKVATYSTIDLSYAITVDGTSAALTVKDTSTEGTGKILVVDADEDGNTDGRGIGVISGSLTLASGTIQAPYAGVYIRPGASMVMDGGTIGGTVDPLYGITILGTGSSLDINGGTVEATYFAVTGNGTAGFGGTIITIDGGTLTSTTAAAIYHPQDGALTITAGTISGVNGIEMKAGNLSVSGGTILGTGAFADPLPNDNGSANTGDAILLNGRDAYSGDITVNITGGIITSTNAYALRDYKAADQALKTSAVLVSGGSFTGGIQAVTFSDEFVALPRTATTGLMLTGGLYNTDPADPDVFVFVPYGTVYNTTEAMYEIVGISLNVTDFYYNNNGILRGVSTDFTVTNFLISEASSVTVNLYSGVEGAYVLQQTNVLKTPASWNVATLTSSFDYFGTYVSNSWTNTDAAGFDPTLAPTRVEVIIVLPGGTLTGFNNLPDGDRTTILPSVSGLVTLQGILAPRAGVPIYLTSGLLVRDTTSTAMTDINYWFTGVETLTYTFTTDQDRYLNVRTSSGKTFLVNRDLTLNPLRLFGGDVNQDDAITVSDASAVGTAWGSTLNPEANINYDGIVNIQDLALVGGNYLLDSATAYNWWSPLP